MLHLDDVQLYDLSEAGRLLFKDPARLEREARLRKLPAVTVEQGLALPAPWVDAEAGVSAADPSSNIRLEACETSPNQYYATNEGWQYWVFDGGTGPTSSLDLIDPDGVVALSDSFGLTAGGPRGALDPC